MHAATFHLGVADADAGRRLCPEGPVRTHTHTHTHTGTGTGTDRHTDRHTHAHTHTPLRTPTQTNAKQNERVLVYSSANTHASSLRPPTLVAEGLLH
jgi:6-phosphogluconolactonase (cycloisomerase 2 family)